MLFNSYWASVRIWKSSRKSLKENYQQKSKLVKMVFFASRDDDNEHILLFFDELWNCIFTILLWKHPVHRGLDGGTKAQLKSTGIPHLGLGRTRQSTTEGRRSLTKTVEIPPLYLERTKFFVCFWQLVLNIELIPLILSHTVFNFEKKSLLFPFQPSAVDLQSSFPFA